ncbi:unnamed protein product [Cunninghamella blakesleeana]
MLCHTTYILHRGAQKEKLTIRSDGYIKVSFLLARSKLKGVTLEQIKQIVEHSDKQSYHLKSSHQQPFKRKKKRK